MAFELLPTKSSRSSSSRGRSRSSSSTIQGLDLTQIESLRKLAEQNNLGDEPEVKEKPKNLSFLQRLGRGLSALEPVNAFYQSNYEGKNFVTTYLKDVLTETGSAITGKELRKTEPKKTFKDVLVKNGMKDREGKIDAVDALGFAGDVLFDPGTWFGGAIAKGAGVVAKGGGQAAVKVGEKVAPRLTKATMITADAAKSAFKDAFVFGGKASTVAKNPLIKFVDEGEAIIDDGLEQIPKKLEPFAEDAVRIGDKEKFTKTYSAEELGMKPDEFFDKVTTPKKLSDEFTVYQNRLLKTLGTEVEKWTNIFRDLPTESKDDFMDGMIKLRKTFGQEREVAIQTATDSLEKKLKDTLTKSNVTLRELKKNYKVNSAVVSQIEKMQDELIQSSDKIRDDLGKFLSSDFLETTAEVSRGVSVKKIPTELFPFAEKVRKYDTFEDFFKSADAVGMEKKVLTGEMEEFGFGGDSQVALKDFFDTVKGKKVSPSSVSESKVFDVSRKQDELEEAVTNFKSDFPEEATTILKDAEDLTQIQSKRVSDSSILRKEEKIKTLGEVKIAFEKLKIKVIKKIAKKITPKVKTIIEDIPMEDFLMDEISDPQKFVQAVEEIINKAIKGADESLPKIDIADTFDLKIERDFEKFLDVNIDKKISKAKSAIDIAQRDKQISDHVSQIKKIANEIEDAKILKEADTAKALAGRQKELSVLTKTLEDTKDIDLESTLDALQNSYRELDELKDLSQTIKQDLSKVFETATKQLVEKFDSISPDQLFKEPETIKFFTNQLLPALTENKATFAKATGMGEDMLMTNYFPFLKKETVKGALGDMRVGKEDYLKRLRGVMDESDMLTNAPVAYAKRAVEVQKDILTRSEMGKWVEDFGKPVTAFKDADEALGQGYRLIKEKGISGKPVGYLKEDDYKFIKEIFDPSFKVINNLAKSLGFDWATGLFKKSVTGLFIPFHTRNFVSGMIQNYQVFGRSAFNPKNIQEGQELAKKVLSNKDFYDEIVEIAGEKFEVHDIVGAIRDRFGISSSYIADFGIESLEKEVTRIAKAKKIVTKGGQEIPYTNPFEMARWVGSYIETQQKTSAVLTALRKGYDMDEALNLAEKAGFDYAKLTPFEKNIMRRLVPFYSFSRKNLELQLSTLSKNPERLGNLLKAGRSAGTPQTTTDEDLKMPDWMRNRMTVNFGQTPSGLPQVISGFGLPIEETADLAQDGLMGVLARLNPLVKVPLEQAVGKDFFREQDIKDVYTAKEYSKAPQILKDFLKVREKETPVYKDGELTGETRTQYVGDPERLHIARNLFTSRGISYLNTLFGEEELSDTGRIIKSLSGARPYEIDQQEIDFFENRDNMRDLQDLLKRYGLLATFERAFIPKSPENKTSERR